MVLRIDWSVGIMEYWNIVKSKEWKILFLLDPSFHYSIFPLSQLL